MGQGGVPQMELFLPSGVNLTRGIGSARMGSLKEGLAPFF